MEAGRGPSPFAAVLSLDKDWNDWRKAAEAHAPDRLRVADLTYVPTWTSFVFLAVVIDGFSRRVVGGSTATQRRPERVIHHCDQGSQYTSYAFAKRCRKRGVVASMGSVGDCHDNAMAESFFATLECELLDRHRFATQAEARRAIFEYIEGGYNPHRRHSRLGYRSPVHFDRSCQSAD